MGKYSTVGDYPIFDNKQFKWTELLEKNWIDIREEIGNVLAFHKMLPNLQDIQQEQNIY